MCFSVQIVSDLTKIIFIYIARGAEQKSKEKRQMVKLIIAFLAGGWLGILVMSLLAISKEAARISGMWLNEEHGTYRCSECGWRALLKCPYCPNCGTKMEGETYNGKL